MPNEDLEKSARHAADAILLMTRYGIPHTIAMQTISEVSRASFEEGLKQGEELFTNATKATQTVLQQALTPPLPKWVVEGLMIFEQLFGPEAVAAAEAHAGKLSKEQVQDISMRGVEALSTGAGKAIKAELDLLEAKP